MLAAVSAWLVMDVQKRRPVRTGPLARMLHEIDENYLFLFHIENCVQEKPIVTHI